MIEESVPIEAPGGFAPVVALGTAGPAGMLELVGHTAPMPVVALAPEPPVALAGDSASVMMAGPLEPAPLVPVYLTLSGEWEGAVRVLRSIDGGATKHPLTVGGAVWAGFSTNVCEPVWAESEAGAALYLELSPASGTITYRLAQ